MVVLGVTKGAGSEGSEAMTTETWRVIDDGGAAHEVAVEAGRGEAPSWWAQGADGVARRSHDSARAAVVLLAQACGWPIAEALAPGQAPRAQAIADAFGRGADLQRGLIRAFAVSADPAEIDAVMAPAMPDDLGAEVPARRLLDAVRDALGPTCADATHEALPWLVAEVVACDAAMHREVDARGERLREMAAEVAHLEARRGALLAEVDRLHALDRDAGVVIEDLRKMLAEANAAVATARADGAREMRERAAGAAQHEGTWDIAEAIRALPLPEAPAPQPVAWGAMPTAAEVAARCEGRAEPHRGAPWMRRHTDTSGDFVEVVYLRVTDGRAWHRKPDGAVWYVARGLMLTSRWRPIDDDGAVAQEVARG